MGVVEGTWIESEGGKCSASTVVTELRFVTSSELPFIGLILPCDIPCIENVIIRNSATPVMRKNGRLTLLLAHAGVCCKLRSIAVGVW